MRTFGSDINLAVLNMRSLLNKTFIMNDLILDNKLDILLLTETWLGPEAGVSLTEACPPDFNFLFSTRGGRGGGTASFILKSFNSHQVSLTVTHPSNIMHLFLAVPLYSVLLSTGHLVIPKLLSVNSQSSSQSYTPLTTGF